ncbi:2,3-diphosphoglycerate-dependent phosphoglycerate mutase [Candidatus Gottesmanbacteria bacterium]|nr:2,3-diphosphoglycerate-dependent phosphoglycerate mutase [Candidatus Gottesmanbacteria bacterium]
MHSYLVLVRHGESEWNARGLWTGMTDVHLTQKGRQEAELAAGLLLDISFHIYFTSTLVRTRETLDVIAERLKVKDMPVVRHRSLDERHYGIYTGQNKWEVKKAVGEAEFLKIRRSWDYPIAGGESLKDVHDRVIPYYQSTIQAHIRSEKNVLIVAHGNSLRALVKHLENVSDEKIADVEIATGEILIYQISPQGHVLRKERRHP